MAKNLGRKYATMSEDERRQFALEEEAGTRELPAELEFEDSRKGEGSQAAGAEEESADFDSRDGMSAQLDDEQHQREVRKAATGGKGAKESETTKSRIDDV
jgi:hypothetical protein